MTKLWADPITAGAYEPNPCLWQSKAHWNQQLPISADDKTKFSVSLRLDQQAQVTDE